MYHNYFDEEIIIKDDTDYQVALNDYNVEYSKSLYIEIKKLSYRIDNINADLKA